MYFDVYIEVREKVSDLKKLNLINIRVKNNGYLILTKRVS